MYRYSTFVFFLTLLLTISSVDSSIAADDPLALAPYRFMGSSSCAAASCHGGGRAIEGRSFAAYQIWIQKDPHARAFEVLSDARSSRMMKLLYPEDNESPRRATEEVACLTCHSTGVEYGTKTPMTDHQHIVQADGVSCEACHGAAEEWLKPHSTAAWKSFSPEEKASLGFIETENDLAARAQLCVECHVGGRGRDVNHDLIAAGHPRLDFELATFHSNLPKHWEVAAPPSSPTREPQRLEEDPAFEVRCWTTGQLVSARASLQLLGQRSDGVWPELSEYSCFACHHNLSNQTWRSPNSGTAGRYAWGTWHFGALEAIGPILGASDGLESANALRGLMQNSYPDPAAVRSEATQLESQLDRLIERSIDLKYTPERLQELTSHLVESSCIEDGRHQSWDHTAQVYLGLVALSLTRQQGRTQFQGHSANQHDLETIRQQLLFSNENDSPTHYGRQRIDIIRRKLQAIRQRLTTGLQ
jgi:hypothetical protein